MTALVPTWSNTTIINLTPTDESLPMRMNHAAPQPDGAREACANCHVNAALPDFYPGHFHGALQTLMLPQPTAACDKCRASSSPVGFVDTVDPSRTPPGGPMKHDAVNWVNGAPTATRVLEADCSTCHVAPSILSAANWKTDANFHAALNASAQPQPTSCLDCHANSRRGPQEFTSANAALPPGVGINHFGAVWLGDCASCHSPGATIDAGSWRGGEFHLATTPTPPTCLPCHARERPTFDDGGLRDPPFDFAGSTGIPHGAGQDCALCHRPRDWTTGYFLHGPTTIAGTTCVVCHSTQRPQVPVSNPSWLDGGVFNHAISGTGDCFGCHQDTIAFTDAGDWACGDQYPGPNLISSTTQFIQVNEITLRPVGGTLVTGTTTTVAILYNAMLHTSSAVPTDAGIAPGTSASGDTDTCWHCHTSTPGTTTVTGFANGEFHKALARYTSTPTASITPLQQPTAGCTDCHSNMRPTGIVQPDAGALSVYYPMDHRAKFDAGTIVSALDCSVCHGIPDAGWGQGAFHSKISTADQARLPDCTVCHYTLMASGPPVDVISAASPSYQMKHRSTQLPFQRCDRCHPAANPLGAPTAASWGKGAFHASLATQPTACIDCHAGTVPTHATEGTSNGQWMNHALAVVAAKDCAFCHATDAKPAGGSWSKSTPLHPTGLNPTTCQGCHSNNTPPALIDSASITSASPSTGRAGLNDQLSHADVNVTGHDCNFCHTAPGQSWAQASFHSNFTGGTGLVINGSTGQCSNCHGNLKPGSSFSPNHAGFGECSSCHAWPGTGGASAPNWHRASAAAAPSTISVGGFVIGQPPAANATTLQAGLNNLPHPVIPRGASCTSCHTSGSGGRGARGYDHALAPSTGCAACHEAGSDLVGSPWTPDPAATQLAAQCGRGGGTIADRGGDTRPVGLTSLACSSRASSQNCGSQNCVLNHFYPSDCGECHVKPSVVPATVQTGASYVSRWRFQHFFGAPAQQATCCHCHAAPSCRP